MIVPADGAIVIPWAGIGSTLTLKVVVPGRTDVMLRLPLGSAIAGRSLASRQWPEFYNKRAVIAKVGL